VGRAGRVVATAVWRATRDVVLSEVDDPGALPALVDALSSEPLSGVHAPAEHADTFARLWTDRHGGTFQLATAQRSYVLERVVPPRGVPGGLRRAGPADRELLVAWMRAFGHEALGEAADRRDVTALADEMIESQTRTGYVWDDAGARSVCSTTGATPHGIRVGAVYTPPESRGHGYASACVAAAGQAELDRGRRWCFLFTDLANPTSNRIYQAIGYRPVRDVLVYRFGTVGAAPGR